MRAALKRHEAENGKKKDRIEEEKAI